METNHEPMMQEIKLVKKNSQIDEKDKEEITPIEIKEPDQTSTSKKASNKYDKNSRQNFKQHILTDLARSSSNKRKRSSTMKSKGNTTVSPTANKVELDETADRFSRTATHH